MTRINLVDPEVLSNKHLVAEYHELPRIFGLCRKRVNAGTMHKVKIPTRYTMGTGHVVFFYDKLQFLVNRYNLLQKEMFRRGYKARYDSTGLTDGLEQYCNNWRPHINDVQVSFNRLCEKDYGHYFPQTLRVLR